jgi:phosphoglycolate phosphatase
MAKTTPECRIILFDVDGVIVDSFESLYLPIAAYFLHQKNETFTREQFRSVFEGNALSAIMERAGIKEGANSTSWTHVSAALFQNYQETKLFEGMIPLLEKLSEMHTLVVVTSSPVEIVQLRFEAAGIDGLFAAYLGPDASLYKDEKIRLVLNEFDAKPEDTCFISDTAGDIVEAKKTGVRTIAVTWGYHSAETLQKVAPDVIVHTPEELSKQLF